ncbi:MAG: hypothetical protein ACYCO0_01160 [Candidatus Micrarchaeaceae archaeon]
MVSHSKQSAVAQEDKFGCSIACVAFVKRTSYKAAKEKYFEKPQQAGTVGYTCKEVAEALSSPKNGYRYFYIKRRQASLDGAIVFIKRSNRYPSGHYLAKSAYGWMDPWIDFKAGRNFDAGKATPGFRNRLTGKAIYAILKK